MTRFPETERARLLALLDRARNEAGLSVSLRVIKPEPWHRCPICGGGGDCTCHTMKKEVIACPSCGCEIEERMEGGLPVSRCTGCESISNLPEEDWREER